MNADGIDIDGCRDVMISDCRIETGDDAICLKSTNRDGAYTNCENITITNCSLTSTSSALKIGTETFGNFSNIVFSNCTIRNTNRGIGIFVRDGGTVRDVIFSNLVMDCRRKHFNWWGDGDAMRFVILQRTPQSKVGAIENILVENVIAHVQGSSLLAGHPEGSLRNITLSNVQLTMHPEELPDKRATDAIQISRAADIRLTDLTVSWDSQQTEPGWKSALHVAQVRNLQVNRFSGRQGLADSPAPAIQFSNVQNASIRQATAADQTGTFLAVSGKESQDIRLTANELSRARQKYVLSKEVAKKTIRTVK